MSVTAKQETERLTQLIRVMRGLSRHERTKHFNMGWWGKETPCGTSMCAAGFCGTDSWFKKRGFSTIPSPSVKGELTLKYGLLRGWDAINEFFGSQPGWVWDHPIFESPTSVGGVIRAAQKRIRELKS